MQWADAQAILDFDQLLKHDFSEVNLAEINALNAEIDYLNKDNGLRFNSSVTKNDFAGLEFGSIWRLNAGFQFDFLNDGLQERKKRVVLLEKDREIKEKELELENQNRNYAYIYNYIIYCFNREKKKIVEQKKFLLGSLINKNFDLYYNHELSYDEILYLKSLDEECDLLQLSMSQVDKLFEQIVDISEIPNLNAADLPIPKFNADSILSYGTNSLQDEILELRKEKLTSKADLNDLQRLSVYVNVHARPRIESQNLNAGLYNSFGLRYQTPLFFRSKEEEKLVKLQKEVLVEKYDDIKFNQNKELINLILDYNTKLRQYSNFKFKLEKLNEKKRVELAVQNVSTLGASTKRNWIYDLEILNVNYELMELKQLIYLSLLRIYNKADLPEILPFITDFIFDESQKRFEGKRVLKITMDQILNLDKSFIINYLEKNNFDYVLCVDAVNCDLLKQELYRKGITFYDSADTFAEQGVFIVPINKFTSRSQMELWINFQLESHPDHYLLFNEIEKLVQLDNKTLGE
jgi:hypothetical protein